MSTFSRNIFYIYTLTLRCQWHRWVTLLSLTQQWNLHCWVWLNSCIGTAESDSTVALTLLSVTLQLHWHRWVWLNSCIDTAESDSTVSLTLLSLTQQLQWHRWVWLNSCINTAESDSTVALTLLSLTQQWQWHRWVWLNSGSNTAESDSTVAVTPLNFIWHRRVRNYNLFFKGTTTLNKYMREHCCTVFKSLLSKDETCFTPRCQWH